MIREKPQLAPGQPVRVFDVNGKHYGQPADGWPGEVDKVGRVLAVIRYHGKTQTFRLDTRHSNDTMAHQWFLTVDETEQQARIEAAKELLHGYGIQLHHGSRLTPDQIEALAAVAAGFSQGS